ncbi:MAG: hypothetical protein DMG31_16780 [Acidobacteria bacterium]|nr:MAG: hypothetical protein DMG31_16780 [Acidobacteriota bacterium]
MHADSGGQHDEPRRITGSKGVEDFLARLQRAGRINPGEGGTSLRCQRHGVFCDSLLGATDD